ncbi:hypothetical protein Dda_7596 [Drechslerella dactyloides]|uniref:Uncharacterized protein n=1 Tax=Drechslerella dactyloides TaxID=74499 RepID=A0AAD6ISX1_DREDA|nr:hypothetical protein Dda_7596 [Drechslerella dactyloides]
MVKKRRMSARECYSSPPRKESPRDDDEQPPKQSSSQNLMHGRQAMQASAPSRVHHPGHGRGHRRSGSEAVVVHPSIPFLIPFQTHIDSWPRAGSWTAGDGPKTSAFTSTNATIREERDKEGDKGGST